jgi:chloramphenicol-sensitive protein RarD
VVGLLSALLRARPSAQPLDVLANRIAWSVLLLFAVVAWQGRWAWLAMAARTPRTLGAYAATALLLSVNWFTWIWAVTNGRIVDASLGYFMTPLVNVALGTIVLGERPRALQWAAVGLAFGGVAVMTLATGALPWIGLLLAFSFGAYGLVRKTAPLGALEGLTLETLLLFPLALGYLAWHWGAGPASFPAESLGVTLWLLGLGPGTAIPLLCFAYGARRMPLTTLGLLQYLSPSIQFALGILVFGEALGIGRLAGFALIWIGLALYSADAWRQRDRPLAARSPDRPEPV